MISLTKPNNNKKVLQSFDRKGKVAIMKFEEGNNANDLTEVIVRFDKPKTRTRVEHLRDVQTMLKCGVETDTNYNLSLDEEINIHENDTSF